MSNSKSNYLSTKSTYELVNIFNREVSHNGWTSERGLFLHSLFSELKNRNVSFERIESETIKSSIVSLKYPVFLNEIDSEKVLIPITQDWLD